MLLLGNPLSSSGQDESLASVLFYDPEAASGTCRDRSLDGCTVSLCDGVDFTLSGALLSAGEVTLDDGTDEVTLTHTAENRYSSAGSWTSGERVHVSASGGAVPAFDDEVTIPEQLVVVAPVFEQAFDFSVDLAAPLEIAWTGGGDATVELSILQPGFAGGPKTTNIVCAFPATAARGTVSPRVLGNLSDLSTAQVTIAAVHGQNLEAGTLDVRIEGVTYPFFGRATFR